MIKNGEINMLLRVLTDHGWDILPVIEVKPTGNSINNGRNNGKTFGRNRERQK